MGVFSEFGAWINQNTQEPLEAESKRSRNVKSKSRSEINTHEERDEMKEQLKLWRAAQKKRQWHDPPPKLKVETRNDLERGLCHMHIEFTLGLPPQAAYDVLTNPDNEPFSRMIKDRELLENISRKVTEKNGETQIVEAEKGLSWKFLSLSGTIPIRLFFIENPKKLYARNVQYGKQKNAMKFMDMFEGSYTVETVYVDSERLCKNMKPKSREEYRKCSNVKLDQIFKPSFLFNVPPVSWYVRRITVKTTKTLVDDLQVRGAMIRGM